MGDVGKAAYNTVGAASRHVILLSKSLAVAYARLTSQPGSYTLIASGAAEPLHVQAAMPGSGTD